MKNRNKTNTAIVTGAARGIGRAITERLLTDGWSVWALDKCWNNMEEFESNAPTRNLHAVEVDVAKETDTAKFFHEIIKCKYGLNAIVNCAAIQGGVSIGKQTRESWQLFFDINVTGAWSVIQQALPLMQTGSSIVNVGSVASVTGFANRAAYCASKHALCGLTRSLAIEFAPKSIRVNLLCLGSFDTSALRANAVESGRDLQDFADRQLVGRLGLPLEAASACSFLVSDHSRFMTGAIFTLDGGMLVRGAVG